MFLTLPSCCHCCSLHAHWGMAWLRHRRHLISKPVPTVHKLKAACVQELYEEEGNLQVLVTTFWRLPLIFLAMIVVRLACIAAFNPLFRLAKSGARSASCLTRQAADKPAPACSSMDYAVASAVLEQLAWWDCNYRCT